MSSDARLPHKWRYWFGVMVWLNIILSGCFLMLRIYPSIEVDRVVVMLVVLGQSLLLTVFAVVMVAAHPDLSQREKRTLYASLVLAVNLSAIWLYFTRFRSHA